MSQRALGMARGAGVGVVAWTGCLNQASALSDAPIVKSRSDKMKEGNMNDTEEQEIKNSDVYVL